MTYLQIIESLVVIGVFFLIKAISNKIISQTIKKRFMQKPRGRIVRKAINLGLLVVLLSVIFTVWGVKQADLAIYIGSILTVVGVAFFAQWSILSNITSSVIIFFNHSIKLDDKVTIMEGKEYEIEGRVSNVGLFFVTLKTDNDEEISLPNNIFIQKMIRRKSE